jgi:hypothetical protein
MHFEEILASLIQERDRLDRAIQALQGTKRRGRPPKNLLLADGAVSSGAPAKRTFSAAARKKMAAAQKKRWAAKKEAQ